jgi:hypothetical protein
MTAVVLVVNSLAHSIKDRNSRKVTQGWVEILPVTVESAGMTLGGWTQIRQNKIASTFGTDKRLFDY